MAEHAGGGGSRRHGRAEERRGDGGCAPRRGVARIARHVLRRGRRRGRQWLLSHAQRSERGLAGGARGRLRRVSQGISGLARARPSERGRAGQAAAPHARSGHGLQGRPAVHAVRHTGRRRATEAMLQVSSTSPRTAFGRRSKRFEAARVATRELPDHLPHSEFPVRLDCERGIPARRERLGDPRSLVEGVPTATGGTGACARSWSGADATLMAAADPAAGLTPSAVSETGTRFR